MNTARAYTYIVRTTDFGTEARYVARPALFISDTADVREAARFTSYERAAREAGRWEAGLYNRASRAQVVRCD